MTSARAQRLVRALSRAASGPSKAWWERYLKGEALFRGVPMADTRREVKRWWRDEGLARAPRGERLLAALELFEAPYTEDKLAGTILLGEELLEDLSRRDLPALAALFERGLLADWNATDWFCVKVLGPLVEVADDPGRTARAIARWRGGSTLWQRRASLVAFANLARHGEDAFEGQTELLLGTAARLVRESERFAQTAVGWVLRELGRAEPRAVAEFARRELGSLSREALRSLTARLPAAEREALLTAHAARYPGRRRARP